ncbi:hypothetical protein [Enterocloster citroniae]|uniref:hypothetical protein n=1 Tax=Enterocloster citroniae TaxID=358743 RepID=UPI0032C16EA3
MFQVLPGRQVIFMCVVCQSPVYVTPGVTRAEHEQVFCRYSGKINGFNAGREKKYFISIAPGAFYVDDLNLVGPLIAAGIPFLPLSAKKVPASSLYLI